MDFDTIFKTKKFKFILGAVGGLIVIMFAFSVGIFIGYHKARFSYSWGENYERNFGGPHRGPFGSFEPFPDTDLMNAHGTSGSVVSVGSSTLIVSGENNMEKKILVNSSTIIRSRREKISLSEIKPNDFIVIIGDPNQQGQINAQLIRLFPAN